MHTLPLPFKILTIFGIWMPIDLSSKWKISLYNVLTVVILTIMYTFVGSELIEVIVYIFEYKGISETLFILLTTGAVCYKAVAFLLQRKNIIRLGEMLLEDCCVPKNHNEVMIQEKFDNVNRFEMNDKIRSITATTLFMVYANIITMLSVPLFQPADERDLPFKTWVPYDLKNQWNYWLSFVHQILGLMSCASISVANDNIVTGFMMQACAQFEILEYRWKILPQSLETIKGIKGMDGRENHLMVENIKHHIHIFQYINEVMSTFNSVILVQFCASSTVITVSVYQLSMKNPGDMDFIMVLLYLMSMLTEFFMYCWFGNEVTLKSIEFAKNVYTTDWILLDIKSWKMLIFIIHRAAMPIVISCYNFIVLSLDTYVHILKISYSAFNVLRQSAENQHNFNLDDQLMNEYQS